MTEHETRACMRWVCASGGGPIRGSGVEPIHSDLDAIADVRYDGVRRALTRLIQCETLVARRTTQQKVHIFAASLARPAHADAQPREVCAARQMLDDALQAMLATGGATRAQAHAPERQIQVVADDEQIRQVH